MTIPALATCLYCRHTVRVVDTNTGRLAYHRTASPRTVQSECPGCLG